MSDRIRVRYAPSPTGDPHVGNIRNAIFTWLFARHHGGAFILRVEDTDQSRLVEGSIERQFDALRWLGLNWDEGPEVGGDYGPYFQSQRLESYQQISERLIASGHAYRCFCSTERLSDIRSEQQRRKQNAGYDRHCRNLSEGERLELEDSGIAPVVRFKMPLDGVTKVVDVVRGEVEFENQLVDDFVMLKSDGFPTYHLANVVDDHNMEISHVIRSEEWLPSYPRHALIYDALDWEPPKFVHTPMVLAPDKSKLSKRHGATSVLEYREMGYVPEAMVNFLALLGWSLDDKTEIISTEDLIRHFSLERIRASGAIFNIEKLNWMNGAYLRAMSVEDVADALLAYWSEYPPEQLKELPDKEYTTRIVPLIQERLKTLRDAAPLIPFFFSDGVEYEASKLIQKDMDAEGTKQGLQVAFDGLSALASFDSDSIEGVLRPMAKELNVKAGQLFGSLRIATTGLDVAPPLFGAMEILGRERTLADISKAIEAL